ncbi:enoyl-CoA hydratase/isomerase family protein [Novosphingobium flavum]|uniref:Enoyl-CoA hydratase/isomerase family protein n=1 Tax=Novosphingobium flavum TaxID=1778672 RepID=A0A7X1FRZ3_9SPHN|nr:3-hydroxyacyl-CoA dehydrogenase NAD-binding domain-containing protein [Novosphingobium flavum]MBC2665883.1 enoyl-CoA hydratase/isomerase family protein [Novosphingobium flavum]
MPISSLTVTDGVAVLLLDNPPVNALSQAVRAAILGAVREVAGMDEARALVIACAGKTFIAGADIKEFGAAPTEPFLPEVIEALQDSVKPVVAALHGTALGGGLEVALACHYRVALPSAKLGLPEVKLGLMPGSRGTQLLPRIVGVDKALEMIAFGNPVGAKDALALGLVDALAGDDLLADTVAFAASAAGKPVTATRERAIPAFAPEAFDQFMAKNARKLRGLDAPPAIVAAVKAATELPYPQAAAKERELFLALREGPQSAALRHVFAAERGTAKLPELDGISPRPVNAVGVVGAGTMGTGIAINFLLRGIGVTLVEQAAENLERGVQTIRKNIAGNVASGRTTQEAGDRALALLTPTLDYADLGAADLLIEAAFETMEVKTAVFKRFGEVAKAGAILATNTSYLDVDAIAAAGGRPADTVGLHFFSPANIMKLLEIVRGSETAPDVLATALDLAKRIGKVPVVSGNAYGFIGNRMLAVRRREAEAMIAEGASPYDIDRVIEGFGLPMGPFKIGDLAGLDLGWSAETSTGSTIRERLNEAGRRGQKTGKGFYDYDENRRPSPSDEALAIIAGYAKDKGLPQKSFTDQEIFARAVWSMVDEGAQILAEGIARSAADIDVVWLNGYGWPAYTGGPMFHAAQAGYNRVASELQGVGIEPSKALLELAAQQAG